MSSLEALRAKMLAQRNGSVVEVNKTTTIVQSSGEVTKMTVTNLGRGSTETVSNSDLDQVLSRIYRLQEHMENSIPGFESILSTIHKQLAKDAALTHLLSEEEIGICVKAMAQRKNIVITAETAKKLGKKALSKTTVDDLI